VPRSRSAALLAAVTNRTAGRARVTRPG
jgi:hypothetical protein